MAEVYSQEWRDDHVRHGDAYIKQADATASGPGGMPNMELFAMAQAAAAHFAAASVPQPGACALNTRARYRLPGIPGEWEISGMETTNGGETGNAFLSFKRVDQ